MSDFSSQSNTQAAINAGVAMATPKAHPDKQVRPHVLVPEGTKVELLPIDNQPRRKSGQVTLLDGPSFASYFKRHASTGSLIFATMDPVCFVAVLNDHAAEPNGQDWGDHRATFKPVLSSEWVVWGGQNGKRFESNIEFAEFIEENYFDFEKPAAGSMLKDATNFKLTRAVKYTSVVNTATGANEFQYATSDGAGKAVLPAEFTVKIPMFAGVGQKKYPMEARLRYRLSDTTGLQIWYDLIRPEKVQEVALTELMAQIKKDTDSEVLYGAPRAI